LQTPAAVAARASERVACARQSEHADGAASGDRNLSGKLSAFFRAFGTIAGVSTDAALTFFWDAQGNMTE
jgi:hypothetical protein